jgi:putative sterol carrier protein
MKSLEDYLAGFRGVIAVDDLGGKSVRMVIGDIGSIYISGTEVTQGGTKKADCVLTASHENYDKMYHGKLDPAIAFGVGKLKMKGVMSVALRMPSLFKKARNLT